MSMMDYKKCTKNQAANAMQVPPPTQPRAFQQDTPSPYLLQKKCGHHRCRRRQAVALTSPVLAILNVLTNAALPLP